MNLVTFHGRVAKRVPGAALVARELGLVELADDPNNRRVRIVCFTEAGKRMSRTVLAVDRRMEKDLAGRIGAHNVATLKRILSMEW